MRGRAKGGAPTAWLASLCAALVALPAAASDETGTRETMAEVFEAMQFLLPVAFDEQRFSDPLLREDIAKALSELARASERLEKHGAGRDAAFGFLSQSLANDARDISKRFDSGYDLEARFLVQTLAETCVACHSRLPAERDAPRSASFVDESTLAALPLAPRAKLAYATRRFERALELYEQIFASPDASPTDFDLDGSLDDYLELCIRVRRDVARPRATLARLAKRADLGERLRGEIASWLATLDELAGREPPADPVAEARRRVVGAEDPERFEDERAALVSYLWASALLHRATADGSLAGEDLALCYYLLGVIETQIGRSFWLSQAEAFLETAIRTAPHTELAERAYGVLEDFLIAGFSGSAGTHVPPDIRAKLDELGALASQPESVTVGD